MSICSDFTTSPPKFVIEHIHKESVIVGFVCWIYQMTQNDGYEFLFDGERGLAIPIYFFYVLVVEFLWVLEIK